jgi:alpha-tubulin suppressor-like RCC1 family protein
MALLDNGTVVAWGFNWQGQLGVSAIQYSVTPVVVSNLNGVQAISAGEDHSLALLTNGSVMAWGYNPDGELGDGRTFGSEMPQSVCATGATWPCSIAAGNVLTGVETVSAGAFHNLALLGDGDVVAWGSNASEQLGNASMPLSDDPVSVVGLSAVQAVSAGGAHSLVLLGNGTVMAWGANGGGQLGNGPTPPFRATPQVVNGLSGVTLISAGLGHNLAALSNGEVMAWGGGGYGELGDGAFASSNVPVSVNGLSGVSDISAGGYHSLALGN